MHIKKHKYSRKYDKNVKYVQILTGIFDKILQNKNYSNNNKIYKKTFTHHKRDKMNRFYKLLYYIREFILSIFSFNESFF